MTTLAGGHSALDDPTNVALKCERPPRGAGGGHSRLRPGHVDGGCPGPGGPRGEPWWPDDIATAKRWCSRLRMSDSRPPAQCGVYLACTQNRTREGKVWTRPRPPATGPTVALSRRRGPEQGGQLGPAGNSQLGIDAAQIVVDRADR